MLDIGFQSTRAIRLRSDGRVGQFASNDKCAAGAGGFIERRMRVDDVVGAVAVHGACGFLGLLYVGIFAAGYPTATFEPSPALQDEQRVRLASQAGFLGVVSPDTDASFDTVLLCEVIEHVLPADPVTPADFVPRASPWRPSSGSPPAATAGTRRRTPGT